jgi:hypothetical protein
MKSILFTVSLVGLGFLGVFVWPTVHKYDKLTLDGDTYPLRIHRITGKTEMFSGEWETVKETPPTPKSTKLPPWDAAKVTGNASLSGYGSFSGKLYNGSSWHITRIIFRVTAKESDKSLRWDRQFDDKIKIAPLSTSKFFVSVIDDKNVDFEWDIVEAWGYKSTIE